MKYYKRVVDTIKAAQVKKAAQVINKQIGGIFIPTIADGAAPRGKYSTCVIFYTYQGGNEWSAPHKVEYFRMYFNGKVHPFK